MSTQPLNCFPNHPIRILLLPSFTT